MLGKKVFKRVYIAQCFVRCKACDSLFNNWDGVLKSLSTLKEDFSEKASVCCEVSGLESQLSRFFTTVITMF